ncbi:MAG: hypothetical protein ACI8WB_005998, partial [Phenylobacterium sp.]
MSQVLNDIERLTDFAYLQQRLHGATAADVHALVKAFTVAFDHLPAQQQTQFALWQSFFRTSVNILAKANQQWPAHKILLQLAMEHADNSPVTQAAQLWLEGGHCDWVWLKRTDRPAQLNQNPRLMILQGHRYLCSDQMLVWDSKNNLTIKDINHQQCLASLPDSVEITVLCNGYIALLDNTGGLKLWDPVNHQLVHELVEGGTENPIENIQEISNHRIITSGANLPVKVWHTDWGKHLLTIDIGHPTSYQVLVLSTDAVAIWYHQNITIWDLKTGKRIDGFGGAFTDIHQL